MQFIRSDLLIRRVFFQRSPRFLPPRPGFQRRFLQQQFLQIIGRVEVGLLARRDEDGRYLFPLQRSEIDWSEKRVVGKGFEPGRADSFPLVFFQQGADRMQTRHRHRWLCDGIIRQAFSNLFLELLMPVCGKWSLKEGVRISLLVRQRSGSGSLLCCIYIRRIPLPVTTSPPRSGIPFQRRLREPSRLGFQICYGVFCRA